MVLPLLERGSIGEAVERWQNFLIGQDMLKDIADGRFGQKTENATKAYQSSKGLTPDGRVGPKTYAKALEDGFDGVTIDTDFPPKPNFPPLVGTSDRQAIFGKFEYRANPRPDNPEAIEILGTWESNNIIRVELPDFQTITGAPSSGKMTFHRLAAPQLEGLWKAWQAKDLLSLILTFGGSFVPRFIRGSRTVLSNHAFGSAFDINVAWNPLGHTPALVEQKGSVRLLVPIANEYGFYWGGHFNNRKDGMHFEVAKILSASQIQDLNRKYGI
ncbi:M15 family metallopeptidase [Leptolyngbya sp. GB1-A1]|uniref:M15 family metallopeptidase n=1 Tax=Leptolyngbya sp. GB1-A1 TaxID=2933908 RepID=UPI003298D528